MQMGDIDVTARKLGYDYHVGMAPWRAGRNPVRNKRFGMFTERLKYIRRKFPTMKYASVHFV